MNDIKIKEKNIVKKIEKNITQTEKFKNNIINTKNKVENENTGKQEIDGTNYAVNKIQNEMKKIAESGTRNFYKYGKKSVRKTYENISKGNERIANIKTKINERKNIKKGTKKTIKTAKNASSFVKKGIKTSKEAVKMSKRIEKVAKELSKRTIQLTKLAVKITIEITKAIIETSKALISLIVAGGWIAIVIIIIVMLLGAVVAWIVGGNDNGDFKYDTSDSFIILVAKTQIGNEGGDKFWQWYGFESYQPWCACYVSYIANECGYIEKGIIPKFSVCGEGIKWFAEKERWKDNKNYIPKSRRYNLF